MAFEDSETSMQGLVLDCCICNRLIIYPIHRPEFLKDWHKHGRQCLECIIRYTYPSLGLGGYIEELKAYERIINEESKSNSKDIN